MLTFRTPDHSVGRSRSTQKSPAKRIRPPTPAPAKQRYAPVFDSDDEWESDYDSEYESEYESDASVASEISFRKRPLTSTAPSSLSSGATAPKQVVSLLTRALKTCSEPASESDDEQPPYDEDDSDEYMPPAFQHYQELPEDQPASAQPVESPLQELTGSDEQPVAKKTTSNNIWQLLRTSVFTALKNAVTTTAKWCSNIAQSTTLVNADANAPDPAEQGDKEKEEQDPYRLFFGPQATPLLPPHNHQHHNTSITIPQPPPTLITQPVDIPIPVCTKTDEELFVEQQEAIPLETAWANDHSQIRRAGPLRVQSGRSDTSYLDHDADWVCCGCSSANTRFEFSCWWCKGHFKGKCCVPVVGEVDGKAGWGVRGWW